MKATAIKSRLTGIASVIACVCLAITLAGCASSNASEETQASSASSVSAEAVESTSDASSEVPTKESIATDQTIENTADGEHAIEDDGQVESYANALVQKTGDSDSGDEADFYGDNAAVFATNGADLTLSEIVVESDGTHANGVFSYGEGTVVNIEDSVIETTGNCSGGLMTTGGGTMNAKNLRIATSGNSSAAIRSDRGGGTVTVDGGVYTTSGTGSPVIYSTADITVSDATMESSASQGVVVEGKNSVTLNNVELTADNNTKNSDKSDWYQAVMIYQSMSGDAASGEAAFTMEGGSLTNKNGDVFFVNNTVATIELEAADIVNEDADGLFLRAAAAGWGSEGSNGGQVTLRAADQVIDGDIVVDDVSNLNFYLAEDSSFTGAINPEGAAGEVYVELTDGASWKLTGDSHITSLTCDADAIDLNGYTLYVDGEAYVAGTSSTGTAIEVTVSESSGAPGEGAPGADGPGADGHGSGDAPGEPPSGEGPSGSSHGGKGSGPSAKPDRG